MGSWIKYCVKPKDQSSQSGRILLYKSSAIQTQLYMNLSNCITFNNRGELTVTVFCNPANCPLVSELKQRFQLWKALRSITSNQREGKDDFTHTRRSRHFWVDPWFKGFSSILPLTIRDSKLSGQLSLAGSAPVGNRRVASLLPYQIPLTYSSTS